MLHHARLLPSGAARQVLPPDELRDMRRELSRQVAEASPLAMQQQRRRKMMARRKVAAETDFQIQRHRERMIEAIENLSSEQISALAACFMALSSETPVSSMSRVSGTVNLDEVPLALRSLGYTEAEEAAFMLGASAELEARSDLEPGAPDSPHAPHSRATASTTERLNVPA